MVVAAMSWSQGARGAEAWEVSQAEFRFTVKLNDFPSHECAGYFVQLPDGGLLPGPCPVTTVVESGGKFNAAKPRVLESYTLWHNKTDGLSLVFADPGLDVETVDIYVTGSTKLKLWTPASGLTPSAILCSKPGKADLSTARGLARLGDQRPPVQTVNKAGIPRAPFSIGGDESGRPLPASFYFLTHVVVDDPGKFWIAPFTLNGACEVRIDDKKLTAKKRIDKWGGTGAYFDLTKGLHRVEVFQTAPGSGPYTAEGRTPGLMFLTWRPPNASMDELGGVRSDKTPMPGTSRMETRVLKAEEIVHSGGGLIQRVASRTGVPVACVQAEPIYSFWFDEESPLLVYEFRAVTTGQPAGTQYVWDMPGGSQVQGPVIQWIFPGFMESQVTLTAQSGAASTRSTATFFGFGGAPTSAANPEHRKAFRNALATMVKSYPSDSDPLASWNASLCNNLIRTTEEGQGYDLLLPLFKTRVDTLQKKLSPAQFTVLQDVFLDMHQQREPKDALQMIDKLQSSVGEASQRDNLLIRKAEIYMYYLNDRDAASRGLAAFAERKGDIAEWARIREGDLAFLAGDLNRATELYADVQKRARNQRNQIDQLVTQELLDNNPSATSKTKTKTKTEDKTEDKTADVLPYRDSNWRAGALRDVSNSENVATLLTGGFMLEAHQALRDWEREFPLSKISGDLLLMEAKYHMKLGDWQRARVMLEAYCRAVDASSFLPESARMLVTCVKEMKSPCDEVRDVIEKVAKRLKYHPVAKELDEFLATGK
jgi:hypothetical protein